MFLGFFGREKVYHPKKLPVENPEINFVAHFFKIGNELSANSRHPLIAMKYPTFSLVIR